MLDLIQSQQLTSFNHFAKYWSQKTGSELLLLSLEGKVLNGTNGQSTGNWASLLTQVAPGKPTFLTYLQQNMLIAPLLHHEQTLGYLLALDAAETDTSLLMWGAETVAAHLIDTQALQNMTDELIGAWDQLELIYRVTQNLALTSDLMSALKSILLEIKEVVDTEDGFVLWQDYAEDARTKVRVTCLNHEATAAYDKTFLDNLINAKQVIVCNNSEACQAIWPQAGTGVERLLATSLTIIEEDIRAAIGLINKTNQDFTAGDVKLLAALAQQVGTIIRNFLTHQRLIVEERLSRELEIAAEIQESLLPTQLPQLGGFSMAVSSVTASEVGGDFYDFVTLDDRYLTLIIGDVSGKGIPAAMLTSVTRTMLRVEALRGEPPHKIIQQANNVLHQDLSRADSFVTVFVVTLDTYEGKLVYASAGHTPTMLFRAETHKVEQLKATALPVGIFGYQQSGSVSVNLQPGDVLVFYTDGITEAQSPQGDLFGLRRLIYIIETGADESPELLQQSIQSEVINFRGDSSGKDDATLLIVKMLPNWEWATPKNISTIIKTADFSYPAHTDYLTDISQQVSAICRDLPHLPSGSQGDDFIYLIELAISEICTNIIKHAYAGKKGEIKGRVVLLNNGVQLDFYDQGAGFDPNTVPAPKSDPNNLTEGGYGLHIVRQIMDVVSYESQPTQGNHWHLIKFL